MLLKGQFLVSFQLHCPLEIHILKRKKVIIFKFFLTFFPKGKSAGPPPTSASVVSKPAMIVAPGATSRLIHPDEDISLVRFCLFFFF